MIPSQIKLLQDISLLHIVMQNIGKLQKKKTKFIKKVKFDWKLNLLAGEFNYNSFDFYFIVCI